MPRSQRPPSLTPYADNQFALPPGAAYTAEWAIVPAARPDYFEFINAARRLLDVNFTIPYGFAFLRGGRLTEAWTDEQVERFIRLKNAHLVGVSAADVKYRGHRPHGVAFQLVRHDSSRRHVECILTNRSGYFGWGDRSARSVHVYDETGREVPDFPAPTIERDGATFTELRIAEGWSAAIVRMPAER